MNNRKLRIFATIILTVAITSVTTVLATTAYQRRNSKSFAPTANSDEESKVLSVLEEMRKGRRYRNVSPDDGRLLRLLTEATDAKRVVEVGTSSGVSAMWFALALRSTGGTLITHEIDSEMAEMARKNFEKAGVDDLITIVEGDAHKTVRMHEEMIDILFLDADKDGYLDYLQQLLPLIRPGGLIIAHNMNHPTPDPAYIDAITKDPELDTLFLLMNGPGIGVTMKKRSVSPEEAAAAAMGE